MFKIRLPLIALLIGATLLETALAIPVNVKLGMRKTIDPDSGTSKLEVLNPSETANLTFLEQGLQFTYIDREQHEKTVRVHFDYQPAEFTSPDPKSQQLIWSAVMQAQQSGSLIAGKIITNLLSTPKQAEIFFNTRGKVGFVHSDFAASSAELQIIEDGIKPTTLKNLAFEAIVNAQVQQMEIAQAQYQERLQAEQSKTNPEGSQENHATVKPNISSCLAVLDKSR